MDRMIVTWFGAGLMKPAPGTWGSAVAVALGVALALVMAVRRGPSGVTRGRKRHAWATCHGHADSQGDCQCTNPADESGCASWQLLTTVHWHVLPLDPD